MAGCGLRCVLGLQSAVAAVSVWRKCFSSHAVHNSMLEQLPCGCGDTCYCHFLYNESEAEWATKKKEAAQRHIFISQNYFSIQQPYHAEVAEPGQRRRLQEPIL